MLGRLGWRGKDKLCRRGGSTSWREQAKLLEEVTEAGTHESEGPRARRRKQGKGQKFSVIFGSEWICHRGRAAQDQDLGERHLLENLLRCEASNTEASLDAAGREITWTGREWGWTRGWSNITEDGPPYKSWTPGTPYN